MPTDSSTVWRPEVVLSGNQVIVPATTPPTPPVARLGPIDLNRPLPDYRQNTTASLAPGNVPAASAAVAQAARDRLARDIFVRLVAVTNPGLIDGPNVAYVNDPSAADYGCLRVQPGAAANVKRDLRTLAQVAANIVDYVDNDDVATVFTWNPFRNGNGKTPPEGELLASATYTNTGTPDLSGLNATQAGDHVVVGTELPRLVVNEAYAMLGNHRDDMPPPQMGMNQNAQKPFQYRFWVELHNPLGADVPTFGDSGGVRLQYNAGVQGSTAAYPVYQLVVTQHNNAGASQLSQTLVNNPENVFGEPSAAVGANSVKVQVTDFNGYAGFKNAAGADTTLVQAAKGATNVPQGSNQGYYVIGPRANDPNKDGFPGAPVTCTVETDYPPDPAPAGPVNAMSYDAPSNNPNDVTNLLANRHTVILRRLANPYLPPNDPTIATYNPALATNPYVTVDFVEGVPTRDQVFFEGNNAGGNGKHKGRGFANNNPNWSQSDQAPSVGRRHPYTAAARHGTAPPYSPQAYHDPKPMGGSETDNDEPDQFIRRQRPGAGNPSPAHSFFYANNPFSTTNGDAGTLAANPGSPDQLRWLQHLDRQLLNTAEVTAVSFVPPALLTQRYGEVRNDLTNPPIGPAFSRHSAESVFLPGLGTTNGAGGSTMTTGGLADATGPWFRALDFLAVHPHHTGVPVGGRQKGLVNLNTVWHPGVLNAVLDPKPETDANRSNYFTDADVQAMWAQMTQNGGNSRSRSATPYDVTQNDQPFYGLAGARGANVQSTLLRSVDGNPATRPLFYTPDATLATLTAKLADPNQTSPPQPFDRSHAHAVTEPLRKMWNNTTTVSNNFLVVMTVGFFEVRNQDPATGRVFLGRELFQTVPGDLREKFVAIVDRTNLGVDATNPTQQAAEEPWFTRLAADVQPGDTTIRVVAGTDNINTNPNPPTIAYAFSHGKPTPSQAPTYDTMTGVQLTTGVTAADAARDNVSLLHRPLRLGFGDASLNGGDGSVVQTLDLVNPGGWANGVATIRLAAAATRYHPAGSPVSNVLLGNPGPQPGFDVTHPRYQAVVPFFTRVSPAE